MGGANSEVAIAIRDAQKALDANKLKYKNLIKVQKDIATERNNYFHAVKENKELKVKLKRKRNSSVVPHANSAAGLYGAKSPGTSSAIGSSRRSN